MKLKIIIYLFIVIIIWFLGSCGKNGKNPVDNNYPEEIPLAAAGPDQTIEAGNFAFVDVSASKPEDKSKIKAFVWIRDFNNPAKPVIYEDSTGTKYNIGFTETGVYNFFLYVITEKEYSEPDTLTITVNQRTSPLIDDINFELLIRYSDNFYNGEITESYLAGVDSISYYKKSVISSVNGLGYCKNLKFLDLSFQNIIDISDLYSLTGLEFLNLSQNTGLETISPLSGLTSIKYLNLEATAVTDISSLENLTSLKFFYIDSSKKFIGANKLSGLVNLEELKIKNSAEKDISFVKNMTNLKVLWLKYAVISDITPVEDLTGLKDLNFEVNRIVDLYPLEKLIGLEKLSLRMNSSITNISSLSGLINLKEIILSQNRFKNIKPLIDNEGIGSEDFVDLRNSVLDSLSINVYLPQLLERGVIVDY